MAAPSIGSGITRLNASNGNTWNSGTVGNADGPIDTNDLTIGSNPGIDPANTCQTFENSNGPSTTSGNHYSAYSDSWTAVDISSANTGIIVHFAGNPGQFNRVSGDSDGIVVYAFDSGGSRATNYLQWDIGGADDTFYKGAAAFFPLLLRFADATEVGTLDETDVIEIGIAWKAADTGNFGVDFRADQIIQIDGEVEFADGDGITAGTLKLYRDELYAESGETYHNNANEYLPPAYGFGHAVRFNCVNFSDSNFTFIFLPDDDGAGFNVPSTGYYSLTVNPSTATATLDFTDGVFAYSSGTYPLDIDGTSLTSGTIDFTRCSFLNTGAVTIDGAQVTMTSCTISNPTTLSVEDADVSLTIDSCGGPVTVGAQLAGGSSLTITNPDADALQFDFNPVDDSGRTYTVPGGETINYNPSTAGTYTHTGITRTGSGNITFDNLSANNITINVSADVFANSSTASTGGGTVTLAGPTDDLTVNSSETGSQIIVFTTNTQTELASEASASQLVYSHSTETVDITVLKDGFIPFRQTGLVLSGDVTIEAQLVTSREYDSSHGLTYTTDASWSRTNNELTVPTFGPTVQGVFSLMMESFRTESALRNTAFNLEMDGINSLYLVNDAEGDADSSIENMTRGGVGYINTSGTVTAEWFGILSVGDNTAGETGEYQQIDGSTTTDARATGDFDEIIKMYGDVTHGNFDYRGHAVFKYQINGFYQARVDVLDLFGLSTLTPTLYTIPLSPAATGITTGDPAISITITDHTAAPITVGGKSFDYEVVDNGTNSAEDILREINYNLSLDATYQGKDPFNYPDMVVEVGGNYESEYGRVEGQDTTTTYHGFYVSRSSSDHPGFSRFQSNDGTYYTPAVQNQATITNLPTAAGANTRLQIYNNTTATEVYSDDPASATYNEIYTEGANYSDGDEVRIRFSELDGSTSFKSFETIVTASATGWSLNAANVLVSDSVYAINAVDGSTVTKFNYSAVDDQFNLAVAQNFSAAELFAFYCMTLTTSAGIEGAFGAFVAVDAGNYKNIVSIASIYLDNETTASQRQTDSARIYRDDGAYPVLDPTTSGYGIDVNWQNVVYVVSTGGSALTPAEAAQLSSIESKTDSLTFTQAGQVDSNVKYVHDIEIDGTGSTGDPWGPV